MKTITQTIVLKSEAHYGAKPPPAAVGEVLRWVPEAVRCAVRMAFEGRSTFRGTRPAWLEAACDIRLAGIDGKDETRLYFEAPQMGDAAGALYEQQELWPSRPDAADTGFDLLGDVISDVAAHNADSERYDDPLLRRVARFGRALNGTFQEAGLIGHRYSSQHAAWITPDTIHAAQELASTTPKPQAVRVMGRIDMIRASTQTFGLKLKTGDEVRAAVADDAMERVVELFRKDVLVLGMAVFRPSGRLLRIDADEIHRAGKEDAFFSKIPAARSNGQGIRQATRALQGKGPISAVFGRWPGDETDEQIEAALKELS